jgi:hypothetical protein
MYKVNIPKSSIKQSTSLLINSNKLHSTINIFSSGIVIKSEDLELVCKTLEKLEVKFTIKKVAS